MSALDQLYCKSIKLCEKYRLMPFENGSMIVLAHIEKDKLIHDINVCFHELGHLFSLRPDDFIKVLEIESIPNDCANNIGAFIMYNMADVASRANELSARAIQIGLNIMYGLWPGFEELSGHPDFPEVDLRLAVASANTADSVIRIMREINGIEL